MSKVNPETASVMKKQLGPWERDNEGFKRVLVVTHGGYIMEMYNVIRSRFQGGDVNNNNNAKNTAIYVFGFSDLGNESDNIYERYTASNLIINHKFNDEFDLTNPARLT